MTADDLPRRRRELDAIDAALAGEPVEPELTELGASRSPCATTAPQPGAALRPRARRPRRRRLPPPAARSPCCAKLRALLLVPGPALAA